MVASDAFYPFNDAIEVALDAGARRRSCSRAAARNDAKAIELCDEKRRSPMWFAGNRHFRH